MKRGDEGYWAWRAKVGRKKSIRDSDHMFELACEYFQTVDDDPINIKEVIKGGPSAGNIFDVPTMAPYTWAGLEAFLSEKGILQDLDDYKLNTNDSYGEFKEIVRVIGKIIYDRNFSGAAVNVFNSNLIARQLGLADKTETALKADIKTSELDYAKLSPETLEELAKQSTAGEPDPE